MKKVKDLIRLEEEVLKFCKKNNYLRGDLTKTKVDFEKNYKYLIGDFKEIKRIQEEENIIDLKEAFLNTDLLNQYEFGVGYIFDGFVEVLKGVSFVESKDKLEVFFEIDALDLNFNVLNSRVLNLIYDYKNDYTNHDLIFGEEFNNLDVLGLGNHYINQLTFLKLCKLLVNNGVDIDETLEDFIYNANDNLSSNDEKKINKKLIKLISDKECSPLNSVSNYNLKKTFVCNGYKADLFYIEYLSENISENLFGKKPKDILEYFNLETINSYKKLLLEDLDNVYKINLLKSLGLNNREIVFLIKDGFFKGMASTQVKNMLILDIFREKLNPKEIYNKINVKNGFKVLRDINSLLIDLRDYKADIKDINYNVSLNNLEQFLINQKSFVLHYDIPYENLDVDYNDDMFTLYSDNKYAILMPLKLSTMAHIGQESGWCIKNTSYQKDVLNQRLIIGFVARNSKIVSCIEFTPNFKEIRQAKSRFNKDLDLDINDFLIDYCYKENILISTDDILKKVI